MGEGKDKVNASSVNNRKERKSFLLPLVVILGPTAVGKTKVSVELAQRIKGEIISGDSMQVYKYMDVGTAKIRPKEMQNVKHYLINIKEPDQPFSVAEFQKLTDDSITKIAAQNKIPILVGGTGLYIQAVIDHYNFQEEENTASYRNKLYAEAEKYGKAHLHRKLAEVDTISAEKIHFNDLKRVIRALEYYYVNDKPISENDLASKKNNKAKYNMVLIGLNMERSVLYERINERVDKMMDEGLLEEVKNLLKRGYYSGSPALQGLGYRQLISYLQGEYDFNTAIKLIKRDTRRFAKRQLTWFRRDYRINWFNMDKNTDYEHLLLEIMSIIGRTIMIDVE